MRVSLADRGTIISHLSLIRIEPHGIPVQFTIPLFPHAIVGGRHDVLPKM